MQKKFFLYSTVILCSLLISIVSVGCTGVDNSDTSVTSDYSEKITTKPLNQLVPDEIGDFEKISQSNLGDSTYSIKFKPKDSSIYPSGLIVSVSITGTEDKWDSKGKYDRSIQGIDFDSEETVAVKIEGEDLFGLEAIETLGNLYTYSGNIIYMMGVSANGKISVDESLKIQKEILKGIIENY